MLFGKVQGNQEGLKVNEMNQQLLVYFHGVNLMGENINTLKKNTEDVLDASKKVDLEVIFSKAMT